MELTDKLGNVYNYYDNYTTAMLCRKFDYSYIENQRTKCKLPQDIFQNTGLKETILDCQYRTENGDCGLLEKRYNMG